VEKNLLVKPSIKPKALQARQWDRWCGRIRTGCSGDHTIFFFKKAPNHPPQPAGFSAGREGWRASKVDKRQTKPVTVAGQPAARTGGVDELANGF
jgi:hypothetical protein